MKLGSMEISGLFAWYDFWIGIYWDRKSRRLYVLPIPTLGIVIQFGAKDMEALAAFLAELDNASPVWLIERGQPEGQSPPCWWNELTERWVFDAAEATHYDTRSCAERALAQRSGIVGVHSPWGHTSEHVFFRMDDAEDA